MRYACQPFADKAALYAAPNLCGLVTSPADDARVEASLEEATDLLVQISGFRQYGVCETTLRPCRECGWGQNCKCGCCQIDKLPIPEGATVTEVKIDGVALDPATYGTIYTPSGRWLIRRRATDDETREPWPYCQDIDLPDTEEDTFSITYETGEVGLIDEQACVEMAIGILRAGPGRGVLGIPGARSASGGGLVIEGDRVDDEIEAASETYPSVGQFREKWNPRGDRIMSDAWSPECDV